MNRFFKRIFGKAAAPANVAAEPPVSLERLRQMLEYVTRGNLCGRGKYGLSDRWIGQSIAIVNEQRDFTAHRNNRYYDAGTIVTVYQSVSWSDMPHHLGVYLVDGELEFRACHEGRVPLENMQFATDPADLAEIKRCFDYWYNEFGLPESLGRPVNPPKQFEPTGNALRDIQTYLEDGSVLVFHELFEDYDPVIWTDWREEDDNIVRMVANVLGLNDLGARFDNDSCELLIIRRGVEHRIRYPDEGVADRDTTIIALNELLQPEHELQLCTASQGSDALVLMALSAADWAVIQSEYPQACAEHFMAITEKVEIFGKSG
jgi:hypothetical protein